MTSWSKQLARELKASAAPPPPATYRLCGYEATWADGPRWVGCKGWQYNCGPFGHVTGNVDRTLEAVRVLRTPRPEVINRPCHCCGHCTTGWGGAVTTLLVISAGDVAVSRVLGGDWSGAAAVMAGFMGDRRVEYEATVEEYWSTWTRRREARVAGRSGWPAVGERADGGFTAAEILDHPFEFAVGFYLSGCFGSGPGSVPTMPTITGLPERGGCAFGVREAVAAYLDLPLPALGRRDPDRELPAPAATPALSPPPARKQLTSGPASEGSAPRDPDAILPPGTPLPPAIVPAHPEVERLRRRFWL